MKALSSSKRLLPVKAAVHGIAWEHCATSYMELLWQLGGCRDCGAPSQTL